MTSRTRSRIAALAAAAVLAPALAACSATNPPASMISYAPGDGVSAWAGPVGVRNMVIIAEKKGGPGTLSAMATNSSEQHAPVKITVGSSTLQVDVAAHGATVIGGNGALASGTEHAEGRLAQVPVEPGSLADVTVSGPEGSVTVKVPVHTPKDLYTSYAPGEASAPSTSTETPNATAGTHGAATATTDAGATTPAGSTGTQAPLPSSTNRG